MSPRYFKTTSFWLVCGVLFFTFALFARTLGYDFLTLDDTRHIPQNPALVQFDVAQFWRGAYFYLYAPVAYTVWSLLYALSPSAWIFHLLNVSLHAANAGLVYLIARRLKLNSRGAFLAAMLFAAHPVQLEAVAWISAGRDQLSAFFGLLALYFYFGKRAELFCAPLLFFLGVLAKPALVTLPLAQWVLRRKRIGCAQALALGAEAILALVVVAITRVVQSPITEGRLASLGVFQRLGIVIDSLGFYARRPFTPWQNPVDFARTPGFVLDNHLYLYGAATLFLAGFVFLRWPQIRREVAFSVVLLLPVSGIIPFLGQIQSTVADRYIYLPMVGLSLILAKIGGSFATTRMIFSGMSLAVLSIITWSIEPRWANDQALFASMVVEQPRSYLGRVNLANVKVLSGHYDEGLNLLREARSLNFELATAHAGLAQIYWLLGRRQELLDEIAPRLRDPNFLKRNADSTLDLSVMYLNVGRSELSGGRNQLAAESFCAYARLDPVGSQTHPEVMATRNWCQSAPK